MLVVGIMPLSSLGIEKIDFTISWPEHGWLVMLSLSCQVIGWISIAYALPRLPAAHTSFALLLQPVLTILWSIIILSETPSTQQVTGMALIFSAIIAVTLFGRTEGSD